MVRSQQEVRTGLKMLGAAVAAGFALMAFCATTVEWKDLVITEPEPVASDGGSSTAGYDTHVCSSESTSESVDITPSGLFIVVQ